MKKFVKFEFSIYGRESVTWTTFEILGPPPYLGNGWS